MERHKRHQTRALFAWNVAALFASLAGAEETKNPIYVADYPGNARYAIGVRLGELGKPTHIGVFEWQDKKSGRWVPQSVLTRKDGTYQTIWGEHRGEWIGVAGTVIGVRVEKNAHVILRVNNAIKDTEALPRNDVEVSGELKALEQKPDQQP